MSSARRGAVAGNNVSWAELVAESALVLAFGGMALKNNDVGGGGTSQHVARGNLRAARGRGVEFHLIGPLRDDLPAEVERGLAPIRPGTDVALMLGMAHTLVAEGRHDRAFLDRYLRRLGDVRGLSARPRRRPAEGCRLGRGRSAACRRTRSSRWRGARSDGAP